MKKIAILLVTVIALTVIGCQPPAGAGFATQEQLDAVKAELQAVKTDLGNAQMAIDSLTAIYNAHVDKYHKGGAVAPKPPKPPTPPPVQ